MFYLSDMGEASIGESIAIPTSSSESEPEPVRLEGPVFRQDNITTLEECSQIYFAGYIAYYYNKKYNCNECLKSMCNLSSELNNKKELLILHRTFSNVNIDMTTGLLSPSVNLQHVVNIALKLFKNKFHKIGHKLHLIQRLVKLTKSVVTLDSVTCINCYKHSDFLIYNLFRILIHKQCKWISNEFKTSALGKLKVLKHV